MISKHIKEACEFHKKFNLGIAEKKQIGMFERNNLLFEEIGELLEAFTLDQTASERMNEMKSEALDVYYILMGNCAYMGIDQLTVPYNFELDFTKKQMDNLIFESSKLAQLTRKKFDDNDYQNMIATKMETVIALLFIIFDSPEEFALLFASHHNRMMNKSVKKIGDVVVVSDFN